MSCPVKEDPYGGCYYYHDSQMLMMFVIQNPKINQQRLLLVLVHLDRMNAQCSVESTILLIVCPKKRFNCNKNSLQWYFVYRAGCEMFSDSKLSNVVIEMVYYFHRNCIQLLSPVIMVWLMFHQMNA